MQSASATHELSCCWRELQQRRSHGHCTAFLPSGNSSQLSAHSPFYLHPVNFTLRIEHVGWHWHNPWLLSSGARHYGYLSEWR